MRRFVQKSAERLAGWVRRVAPSFARLCLRRQRYDVVVTLLRNDERRLGFAAAGHPVVEEKAGRPVWLSIICPCRCGTILRVNLMTTQTPVWTIDVDERERLTVSPSLDASTCASHFWIRDGRVDWV